MNIEIVAFYQHEKDDAKQTLFGTLHVYLVDYDIDLRGVFVSRRKDAWFFSLPSRPGFDQATGKAIRYPCITFKSREKQNELIDAIREKGRAYIEARLADTENPLIYLQKPQQLARATLPAKRGDAAPTPKEIVAIAKPQSVQPKEWRDPPIRNPFKAQRY